MTPGAASPTRIQPKSKTSAGSGICVIIVTYNGRQWLDKCIGGLYSSGGRLGIVVIDNDSSDGTPDIIRERWPGVKLIEPGENLGFGRANNIGFRYALDMGFDYAYLLNQDAWIDPSDIFLLAELQSKHPEYGVLSPMQMQADRVTPDKNFGNCCKERNCPGYMGDVSSGRPLREIYPVEEVMAAHWLVSAEAIGRIGGFAPIFRHYGEDYNFLNRLSYHGFKAGICPAVKAVHDRADRPIWTLDMNKAVFMTYNAMFLHMACNITKSGFCAMKKAFKLIIKYSCKQAFKYKSFRPLANPVKAVRNIGKIMATRKETKIPGPHYLR